MKGLNEMIKWLNEMIKWITLGKETRTYVHVHLALYNCIMIYSDSKPNHFLENPR